MDFKNEAEKLILDTLKLKLKKEVKPLNVNKELIDGTSKTLGFSKLNSTVFRP